VERIGQQSESIAILSDGEIRHRINQINIGLMSPHHEEVEEGFALIREAAVRALGMRTFDGQILAALGIDDGSCVEMLAG